MHNLSIFPFSCMLLACLTCESHISYTGKTYGFPALENTLLTQRWIKLLRIKVKNCVHFLWIQTSLINSSVKHWSASFKYLLYSPQTWVTLFNKQHEGYRGWALSISLGFTRQLTPCMCFLYHFLHREPVVKRPSSGTGCGRTPVTHPARCLHLVLSAVHWIHTTCPIDS